MDIEINKRDDSGQIIDVDLPKKIINTELAKETEALTPDKPLPDLRVERFLMEIAENAVTGTEKIFNVYKKCGFPVDMPIPAARNEMRKLLNTPAVKERLKYLKQSEWELNRPDIINISRQFEDMLSGSYEDLTPSDRIKALNSLAKLVGLLDRTEEVNQSTQVAVVFNGSETGQNVKDIKVVTSKR